MIAVLLTLAFVAASTQSLNEAARRAKDQRRETGPAVLTLTNHDLARTWEITGAGLARYAAAKADLQALRQARPEVHRRLFDASRGASHLAELEPALEKEPRVMAILEKHQLTPRQYLEMNDAIVNALYWSRLETPEAMERQLILMENVRFIRRNPKLVREHFGTWGWGDQWFDENRFIQHF